MVTPQFIKRISGYSFNVLKPLTHDYAYTVLDLLRHTTTSIDILAYVTNFNMYKKSDKALLIFLALKNFPANPNDIRIILDYPHPHKPNYHANLFSTRRFQEANFNVRYLHSGSTQHAKLMIFDQTAAVLGSHNLTTKSVISPYDISLLLDDPGLLSFLVSYFDRLWHSSIEA